MSFETDTKASLAAVETRSRISDDQMTPFGLRNKIKDGKSYCFASLSSTQPLEEEKKIKGGLFEDADPFQGKERIENLSPQVPGVYRRQSISTPTALKKFSVMSTPYSHSPT